MKQNKKCKWLWIFLPIILVLSVCLTVVLMVKPWQKQKSDQTKQESGKIVYYPTDYDEDILQDRVYLSYDRDLLFGSPYQQRKYHFETEREEASEEAGFFLDFFQCLIMGESDSLQSFFVQGYFAEEPHFTMQMIHDISVVLHSVDQDTVNGISTEVYSYTVTYEIFRNNGTWRQGVGSNDARPQIYQLIRDEDGNYKIWRILDVVVE